MTLNMIPYASNSIHDQCDTTQKCKTVVKCKLGDLSITNELMIMCRYAMDELTYVVTEESRIYSFTCEQKRENARAFTGMRQEGMEIEN